jgi:hypothetical protein
MAMSPATFSCRPVASTTMSAARCCPLCSCSPVAVKRLMVSVTTAARPARICWNMSPSGATHTRWSQGL